MTLYTKKSCMQLGVVWQAAGDQGISSFIMSTQHLWLGVIACVLAGGVCIDDLTIVKLQTNKQSDGTVYVRLSLAGGITGMANLSTCI